MVMHERLIFPFVRMSSLCAEKHMPTINIRSSISYEKEFFLLLLTV